MNSSFPSIQRLKPEDITQFRQLNCLFANCFDDHHNYQSSPPSDDYLAKLLEKENVIPLVALADEYVVGGLVAYELDKFEQERREIYIYDLAVDQGWRRMGIAKALIAKVREIARRRNAWVVYVQADHGDEPAIALYTDLGLREDVLHFDIEP